MPLDTQQVKNNVQKLATQAREVVLPKVKRASYVAAARVGVLALIVGLGLRAVEDGVSAAKPRVRLRFEKLGVELQRQVSWFRSFWLRIDLRR